MFCLRLVVYVRHMGNVPRNPEACACARACAVSLHTALVVCAAYHTLFRAATLPDGGRPPKVLEQDLGLPQRCTRSGLRFCEPLRMEKTRMCMLEDLVSKHYIKK